MEKFTVRIPKIGSWIDQGTFGGIYVDKRYQEIKIKEAKENWRDIIKAKLQLCSEVVENTGENYREGELPFYIKYLYKDNPYFGWKMNQLEIIIEK